VSILLDLYSRFTWWLIVRHLPDKYIELAATIFAFIFVLIVVAVCVLATLVVLKQLLLLWGPLSFGC